MTEAETAIILVTDLVGSTALRSEIGEDAAEELRHSHDALLADAVRDHGGVVVKSLGDGILARFGGAASAVTSACVMQQQVDGRFDIRIGVSAGDVTLEDGDCFGAPVIEACRLCDRAEGGQILVADLVRMLARGRGGHVFEPVGELELKGASEPVAASQVVWDNSRYDRIRFPEALVVDGMPFVGRERELGTVTRCWQSAASESSQVVLIYGEPGIGKTRLIAEVAQQAHATGGAVLYGRFDDEAATDHHAFTEALTPLVADLPDHVIEAHVHEHGPALVSMVPLLKSRIPGLEQRVSTVHDPQRAAEDALTDLVRRAGEIGPVMLVLEDLHHARGDAAQIFRQLARVPDLGPVLIVGSYSYEVRHDDGLRTALRHLRRASGVVRVPMNGLNLDEVVTLVTAHGAGSSNWAALAHKIHTQTNGNPVFVEEALRQIADSKTTFHLDLTTRRRLATIGAAGLVIAAAIVIANLVIDRQTSTLEWILRGGAFIFFAVSGTWLIAQVASAVSITPDGLTVTATGGIRRTAIRWDDIEGIRWRPPTRLKRARSGGFFIETTDGQHISNPLIDHPTREFAQAMYAACSRHHVNATAIRARWPKPSGGWPKSDRIPPGQPFTSKSDRQR